jgi:hypothetical protein
VIRAKNQNQQIGSQEISCHRQRQDQAQQRIQASHSVVQGKEAKKTIAPRDNGFRGGVKEYT